jgi:hypothetical protein
MFEPPMNSSGKGEDNPATQPAGPERPERGEGGAQSQPPSVPVSVDIAESAERSIPLTPPAPSADRVAPLPMRSEDTLLSLPAPADAVEFELDERVSELERRLASAEARLDQLEAAASTKASASGRWWLWVAFLLLLAASWPLVNLLR